MRVAELIKRLPTILHSAEQALPSNWPMDSEQALCSVGELHVDGQHSSMNSEGGLLLAPFT